VRVLLSLALVLLAGACAHIAPPPVPQTIGLRAMTFNIRLDIASDGANAWPNRKAMAAEVIRYEAPAVLGLQEVLLHQKTDLEAALPDYAFIGVARDDGADKGEFSSLAFRRDRFDLLESGTFWLSLTPSVPGKAWDAAYPRIATWAVLKERTGGRRLAVLNTHFDHVGIAARANSAAIIADWAGKRGAQGDAVVVLGDFNSPPSSPPMALLADHARSGLRLARSISSTPPYGPPGTFNAFKIDSDAAEPIDHILVSDHFDVLRFATVTQHWGGRLPSDHYPVVADLVLRR
jgi:endonuclease/exonuclease/phosphatase family metal-dependent hydrolase